MSLTNNNNDDDNKNTKWDFLLDRLDEHTAKTPNKIAVAFLTPGDNGGKLQTQFTYQELQEVTNQLSKHLIMKGLKPGDRAVLVYPPSLDFMVAFLACLKAKIIAVPVFPPNPVRRDTLQMFSVIVASCQANFALTSQDYNYAKKMASIKDTLTKFNKRPGLAQWPETLTWIVTDRIAEPGKDIALPTSTHHVAFLQYTSGSTSEPKGVQITHQNLAHNLSIITRELQAKDDTVVVSWLPQYHDMGLIGSYLGVLYCGGTGYYMSPLSFLQRPMLWIEAISKYRATHLQAPNFAYKLTARKFTPPSNKLDLSSVQHMINGAEPVDEESMEQFYKVFGKFGVQRVIYPTYGLAEHTVFVCSGGRQRLTVQKENLEVQGRVTLAKDDSAPGTTSRLVGCGFPARNNVLVKIVDTETMQALPEDTVGEIWVNSPSKAAGYYNKPEETARDFEATLKDDPTTHFLRTGDLGFLHKDELFICGRLKDLIIVGGRNYYPQDIETTAESSSDLVRPGCSAAFTIDPTHEGGEEVALVMELKDVPGLNKVDSLCGPLAESIRAAVNMEHSVGITEILFLEPRTIPKTSSGKIARSWCRKGFLANTLKVVYRKNFKSGSKPSSMEMEGESNGNSQIKLNENDIEKLRSLSKKELLPKLTTDVSRISSIATDLVDPKAPLITMMDSLTISQFKGLLETHYAVKVSDEYLFRESTTLNKLVEVVKLGHAPDDGHEGASGSSSPPSAAVGQQGKAEGLAGALGCPPGVVCILL